MRFWNSHCSTMLSRIKGAWHSANLVPDVEVQRSTLVVIQELENVMSRQFRKAYEYARACARGRPPRPKERLYLCNWYVKLVKPGKEIPSNQVQCHVPMK